MARAAGHGSGASHDAGGEDGALVDGRVARTSAAVADHGLGFATRGNAATDAGGGDAGASSNSVSDTWPILGVSIAEVAAVEETAAKSGTSLAAARAFLSSGAGATTRVRRGWCTPLLSLALPADPETGGAMEQAVFCGSCRKSSRD